MKNQLQGISSAATSVNTVPRLFKVLEKRQVWKASTVLHAQPINLDLGGGRFETTTAWLAERGVRNLVLDPYNRSEAHNRRVERAVRDAGGAPTITVANVLNVIREPAAREAVLGRAVKLLARGGTIYVAVYEGDRSGKGRETTKGWQENRPVASYLPEVRRWFGFPANEWTVSMESGIISIS